jgi:hypothetical protein
MKLYDISHLYVIQSSLFYVIWNLKFTYAYYKTISLSSLSQFHSFGYVFFKQKHFSYLTIQSASNSSCVP